MLPTHKRLTTAVLLICALPIGVLAQQVPVIPQTCEDKLATAEKTSLVLRDDRERWQGQFVLVWQRAEKAEAEVTRLSEELRKVEREKAPAPNGKGTN